MAIFSTFQTLVIFRTLGLLSSRFLDRTSLMCFYSRFVMTLALLKSVQKQAILPTTLMFFYSPFCQDLDTFKFRPKIGHFALQQPMQYGHFFHFSNSCHFSNIRPSFEPFSGQNKFNVFLQSLCYDFGTFKIRPKIGHFTFLQPIKYGHFWHFSNSRYFSNIRRFFGPFSAQNNLNVFLESFLLRLWHF